MILTIQYYFLLQELSRRKCRSNSCMHTHHRIGLKLGLDGPTRGSAFAVHSILYIPPKRRETGVHNLVFKHSLSDVGQLMVLVSC